MRKVSRTVCRTLVSFEDGSTVELYGCRTTKEIYDKAELFADSRGTRVKAFSPMDDITLSIPESDFIDAAVMYMNRLED